MSVSKKFSEITHAEWIVYQWITTTPWGDPEPIYLRVAPRPLDDAMRLSGGSIKTLEPFLWALDENKLEEVERAKNARKFVDGMCGP